MNSTSPSSLLSWRHGLCISMCGILPLLSHPSHAQSSAQGPTGASIAYVRILEAAGPLGWPIAAIVIALLVRSPVIRLVSALAGRISKLSLFKVEIELAVTSSAGKVPLLDAIRDYQTPDQPNSSELSAIEAALIGDQNDCVEINLGEGNRWLTSRLFVAVVLMARMRGVQALVFVETTATARRRFVAIADAERLRWSLAKRFPWLEVAWHYAFLSATSIDFEHPAEIDSSLQLVLTDYGAIHQHTAMRVLRHFVSSLQTDEADLPDERSKEWTRTSNVVARRERASWVTSELLENILPREAFSSWAYEMRDASRNQKTAAILRRHAPFVALVGENQELTHVVNRASLLEKLAESVSEEAGPE